MLCGFQSAAGDVDFTYQKSSNGCVCIVMRNYLKPILKRIKNNALKMMLRQHLPVESAYAPFYFTQNNPVQHLLHALKYQGKPKIGDWMAKQCFALLPQQHLIKQCDAVVPVPLHPKREKQRGYNQSTRFGQFWAKQLGVPFLNNLLLRKNETKTLVRMSR